MSAESEIADLLARATASTDFLAERSTGLVDKAITALNENSLLEGMGGLPAIKPQGWTPEGTTDPNAEPSGVPGGWSPSEFTWARDLGGDRTKPSPPPSFPMWPELDLGEVPPTQEINDLDPDPEPSLEPIDLPAFTYSEVADLVEFNRAEPTIDTALSLPSLPDTAVHRTVTLRELLPITDPEIVAPEVAFDPVAVSIDFDPTVFPAAFAQFTGDIFGGAGGLPGIDTLLTELGEWTTGALDTLKPLVLETIAQRFRDRYAPVLVFSDDLQQRLDERLDTEQRRVMDVLVDPSGWDRPAAAQAALLKTAAQAAKAWAAQAQSQSDTQTAELALSMFEFCGDLFDRLNQGVQALKIKELEQVLEAHRLAIAYAKQATAALLAAFEANYFTRQNLELKKSEAQVAVFEANLKLAMTQYEVANANLEVEKARQDTDAERIALYQTQMEQAGIATTLYAAQVSAARSELDGIKLPLDVFESRVKVFDAQVNAHQARVSGRLAQIEGDSAKVNAQLAKVSAFEAEVAGFEELIATRSAVVQSETERNDAVIAEFKTKVQAVMRTLEKDMLKNKYDFSKYQVLSDHVISEAQFALKEAEVESHYTEQLQGGIRDAYQITQTQLVSVADEELNRLKTLAEVNADGARIMESMASGAMSAANGVASAIFSES